MFVLLGYGFPLGRLFLAMPWFFHFGRGLFALCCYSYILPVCNLFWFYRSSQLKRLWTLKALELLAMGTFKVGMYFT